MFILIMINLVTELFLLLNHSTLLNLIVWG